MNKRVVENLSFNEIFQILKKSWILVFLLPFLLTVCVFLVLKSKPDIWEGQAVIKVGRISPAGIGLLDRDVLTKIEAKWKQDLTKLSGVEYSNFLVKSRDDFFCEVNVGSQQKEISKEAIDLLFNLIKSEQTQLLNLSLKDHNHHIDKVTGKINQLQESLKDHRRLLASSSKNGKEYLILMHLISTQENIESELVEKRLRLQGETFSNLNLVTNYQEGINLVPSPKYPNRKLIVMLVFVFSLLTTSTVVLIKRFIQE